jgi:hypothetical protein
MEIKLKEAISNAKSQSSNKPRGQMSNLAFYELCHLAFIGHLDFDI